jgi:hypothetical protein
MLSSINQQLQTTNLKLSHLWKFSVSPCAPWFKPLIRAHADKAILQPVLATDQFAGKLSLPMLSAYLVSISEESVAGQACSQF